MIWVMAGAALLLAGLAQYYKLKAEFHEAYGVFCDAWVDEIVESLEQGSAVGPPRPCRTCLRSGVVPDRDA